MSRLGTGNNNLFYSAQNGTTACPGCWALGTNKVKQCSGLTRAAKARRQAQRTNQEMTYSYVLLESPLPQFQQSAGATTL